LIAKEIVTNASRVFERTLPPGGQKNFAAIEHPEPFRDFVVATIGQFIGSKLSICPPRTSANKGQFAVARALRIPFEVIVDLDRLSIFVNAKDADIQVEPGIFEVVRIAAVKSHLLFGCEDDADIVVALVTI
jgi:hypothetical protein